MKCEISVDPRVEFFDSIADKWDGWHDLQDLRGKLAELLEEFGINESESILDIGCGTGNFTLSLLRKLGPAGRIIAVDISSQMIGQAKRKVADARVTWHQASAEKLPVESGVLDRVICFSVWPHFGNHEAVLNEIQRVLRPGGNLHIVHLISREQVNRIHSEAHPSVCNDYLSAASVTADQLRRYSFKVSSATDNEQRYIISACKAV